MWNLKSKLYYMLYSMFGKWLPESHRMKAAKAVRGFFSKRILTRAGKKINIEHGAYFTPGVFLGDYSGIGVNCELYAVNGGKIIIGNYVMMGPECVIYTSSHAHDRIDIPMQQQGSEKPKDVIIGDDVWIGRRVSIMPGVTIGKGCIIGTGAVVTKSVPDYSVAVGVPARVIKKRGAAE